MSEDCHDSNQQAADWPDCVPVGYRTTTFLNWRHACFVAQADGWRWEHQAEDGWIRQAYDGLLRFSTDADFYRIACGPAEGREVKRGDGVWKIPRGADIWGACKADSLKQWIPSICSGSASLPGKYYKMPEVAQPAAPDEMTCGKCGKTFDPGDLDEVLFHETHEHRPDIQYSGSKKQPAAPDFGKLLADECRKAFPDCQWETDFEVLEHINNAVSNLRCDLAVAKQPDGCQNCVRLRTEINQSIGILYGGLDRDRDDGDTLRTLCVVLVNALARERGHA